MRVAVLVLLCACSFKGGDGDNSTTDAGSVDARVDAAPRSDLVKIVSVVVPNSISPGDYGFEVIVSVMNEFDRPIDNVEIDLRFADTVESRDADFDWRDADRREMVEPWDFTIDAGGTHEHTFIVNARASLDGGAPVIIDAVAAFRVDGEAKMATPLDTAPFSIVPEQTIIVVDEPLDVADGAPPTSLREAIAMAALSAKPAKVVFDPAMFPPLTPVDIVIESPLVISSDVIIDGSGAGVVLIPELDDTEDELYGIIVTGGRVLINELGFRDMSLHYPEEDLSADNCGSNIFHSGGAILVSDGTLILRGSRFSDPNVPERNCHAALVRLHGGIGHRVIGNTFSDPSGDLLSLLSPTIELRDNLFLGPAVRSDDAIVVGASVGAPLWIVGNVVVDQEVSGILVGGPGDNIHVANNTFIDLGGGSSAIHRAANRAIVLRNNVYLRTETNAIEDVVNDGAGLDISHELIAPTALCATCGSATVVGLSILTEDPGLLNETGTSRNDFIPAPQSPLIDTGRDFLDRNGKTPGRYSGNGAERGANELP